MTASGHKVKQVTKVNILGYIKQSNLQHDKHIAQLTSNINSRLYNIKKLSSHSTIKSRTIITKAIVIGKIVYCLPLLCNAKKSQLAKLNTLVMKTCRVIMGNPCMRWTNTRLLNKCKMNTIYQMITEQAINFIHKIQTTTIPQALYTMYNIPTRPQRTIPQLFPIYTPRTKHLKNSIFFKFSSIYSNLPDQLKANNITKFKKLLKIHIQENFHPHTLPQTQHESDTDSNTE